MHNRTPEISVLLTGEAGFIFRNLQWQLQEATSISLILQDSDESQRQAVRPEYAIYIYSDKDVLDSERACKITEQTKNEEITRLSEMGTKVLILGPPEALSEFTDTDSTKLVSLPLVFGKWEKPGENSPIASACKLVLESKEAALDDNQSFELLYIDDLAYSLLKYLEDNGNGSLNPGPLHKIAMVNLRSLLVSFRQSRKNLLIPAVGEGLIHALYATYISYMGKESFSYPLENHADNRGSFIEILKTELNGQVSCLTAGPGITRGQHYHHSKSEKFLVVKGTAKFSFRNLLNQDTHEIIVSGVTPQIVETIPGWVHNITNISNEEMIVILWANELFNPEFPDTIPGEI